MKKLKMPALVLLALLTLACLTGCGSNQKNGNTSSSAAQTTQSSGGAGTESSGSAGNNMGTSGTTSGNNSSSGTTSGNVQGSTGAGQSEGTNHEESSSGVFEGLMDDVESGAQELTGEGNSRASDESK